MRSHKSPLSKGLDLFVRSLSPGNKTYHSQNGPDDQDTLRGTKKVSIRTVFDLQTRRIAIDIAQSNLSISQSRCN